MKERVLVKEEGSPELPKDPNKVGGTHLRRGLGGLNAALPSAMEGRSEPAHYPLKSLHLCL
jgi:hypothetical protein